MKEFSMNATTISFFQKVAEDTHLLSRIKDCHDSSSVLALATEHGFRIDALISNKDLQDFISIAESFQKTANLSFTRDFSITALDQNDPLLATSTNYHTCDESQHSCYAGGS
jgi:hypothetical protein